METIRERRMRKKREMQEAYQEKYGKDVKSGNVPSYAQWLNMKKYRTVRSKAFDRGLLQSGIDWETDRPSRKR